MTTAPSLAFFTRVLDDAPAAERYRRATEQIRHAEAFGFDSAWVAQHHFDPDEGGLPSPLVFLAHVAATTGRIRLGTGIITLGMEDPVRVAEDAVVLDALSGGRLEIGLGTGGTPSSFGAFGADFADRHALFDDKLAVLERALAGREIDDAGNRLWPAAGTLAQRLWFATFSAPLAERAGRSGYGLQLSRTQPHPGGTLAEVQTPLIDAYEAALRPGAERRLSVARTVFVGDDHDEAVRLAVEGYRRSTFARRLLGDEIDELPAERIFALADVHAGDPESVARSLAGDGALARADQVSIQVHSVDPPHELILRSIELFAREVVPLLGWERPAAVSTPLREDAHV